MGKLSLERFGYSMPVTAPLFAPEGGFWAYRGCEGAAVLYESDGDSVEEVLPPDLVAAHDPPRILANSFRMRSATVGDYHESNLMIWVKYTDRLYLYPVYVMCGADEAGAGGAVNAIALGREVLGAPKKLAHMSRRFENATFIQETERPAGKRIMTLTVRPTKLVAPEEALRVIGFDRPFPMLSLRVIPSAEGPERPPAVAELLENNAIQMAYYANDTYLGVGSLTFDSPSEDDPWYRLKVNHLIAAMYGHLDINLGASHKVIKRYV